MSVHCKQYLAHSTNFTKHYTRWLHILWTDNQYSIPNRHIAQTITLSHASNITQAWMTMDLEVTNIISTLIPFLLTKRQNWAHRDTTFQLQRNIRSAPQVPQSNVGTSSLGYIRPYFYTRPPLFKRLPIIRMRAANNQSCYSIYTLKVHTHAERSNCLVHCALCMLFRFEKAQEVVSETKVTQLSTIYQSDAHIQNTERNLHFLLHDEVKRE